jgi:hypothetical protein
MRHAYKISARRREKKSGLNNPRRIREENTENGSQKNAVKEGRLDSFGTGRKTVAGSCRYHYKASG